jgi:hypothetical protein
MSGAPDEKTVRTTKDEIWPEAWAAYAACAWALAFAVVHLYWALGGAVGLPPGMSVGMNRALFVIDIVAVPLCVAGDLSLLERWSLFVYEPWFFTGGVLYGAAAWSYGRRSRRPGP